MIQLHQDPNFHYEAIRSLGLSRYFGGDIGEQLAILDRIQPRSIEDWYREWHNLALRVLSTVDENNESAYAAATLRDVYFRVSHYFFVADFFLHGNPTDPRLRESYDLWRKYFDKANALLPIPGQHALIPTEHGFEVPVIIYHAQQASESNPRPTLIIGGGFDSNYEETLHVFGFPALERGYNVVLYEGPGQPSLLHKQNKGFIYDWEKAVTPVVDHLFKHASGELSFIDTSKIGLVGMSLGGYLSARAAAFEPRLAAVLCIDGVWSFHACVEQVFPDLLSAFSGGDQQAVDAAFDSSPADLTTNRRWFRDHLKFSFRSSSGFDVLKQTEKMTMEGIADKIKMPAFIGEAEGDIFFGDQPAHIAREIGSHATLVTFGKDQAAEEHCQSAALVYLNQRMLEWFARVVGERK